MKAAFVKKPGRIELRDIARPRPGERQVLLRVLRCGLCGSDFLDAQAWAADWKRFGHEVVGEVVAMGAAVSRVRLGDVVAVANSVPCGVCSSCGRGDIRHCRALILVEQGGFGQYLLAHEALLFPLPAALPLDLAVLAEPLSVVADTFRAGNVDRECALLVVGGGLIARLALLTVASRGVPCVGVVSRKRSASLDACLAASGGAFFSWRLTGGLTTAAPPELAEVLSAQERRVVVLHTAPPWLLGLYLPLLPFGAEVVSLGLAAQPQDNNLAFDASLLVFRRLRLSGAIPVPCLTMDEALNLLRDYPELFGRVPVRTEPLSALPDLIAAGGTFGDKVVIVPWAEGETEALSERIEGFLATKPASDSPFVRGMASVRRDLKGRDSTVFMSWAPWEWAGHTSCNAPLEAFGLLAEGFPATDLEYAALARDEIYPLWARAGELAFPTGGPGPVAGFAIRLRGATASDYDICYKGLFQHAGESAVASNGEFCRAHHSLGDALVAVAVVLIPRTARPVRHQGDVA